MVALRTVSDSAPHGPTRLGNALARLALGCAHHPGRVGLGLIAALALAVVVLASARVDLSFAGLMDREHPEIARYFEASERYGLGGRLALLVEADDDAAADDFLDELAAQLRDDDRVRRVATASTAPPAPGSEAWWVSPHTFARWKAWSRRPTDPQRLAALREALDTEPARRAAQPGPPGVRLCVVTLAVDSFARDLDEQDFPAIDQQVQQLARDHGVRARFAGMPAIVAQDEATTLGRIGLLTPLSLVLALALLLGMERRVLGLVAIAIPMVAAAVVTLAIMALTLGRVTLMESLFGVLVFGLGVDVALHLGLCARQASDARLDFEPALAAAFATAGPGVVVGGLTTAGAFAVLALAPEPSFVHLGASGAVGVACCLLAMLTVLPAAWAVLGAVPRGPRRGRPSGLALVVGAIGRSATRHPLRHLLVALAVVVAAATGLPRLSYESDLNRVVNRDVDAIATAERLHQHFGVHPMPWVIPAESVADARRLEAKLAALPSVGETESLAGWVPSDQAQRGPWLEEHRARLDALAERRPALAALVDPLRTAADESPPAPTTLPAAHNAGLVTDDGTLLVFAFAATPHMDARLAAQERRAITEVAPEATSMAVLFELLLAAQRPWMPWVVGGALAFVAAMLLLDLRRPRRIALALLPVVAASLLTFGLLGWLGVRLNTVTAMAAPLVLGLGVDDGIHMVHRLRDRGGTPDSIAEASAAVSHAIALTTATTCTSFSTLLLSGHPGLESMAVVMLLALPACLLASASTLPAAAMLLRRI